MDSIFTERQFKEYCSNIGNQLQSEDSGEASYWDIASGIYQSTLHFCPPECEDLKAINYIKEKLESLGRVPTEDLIIDTLANSL